MRESGETTGWAKNPEIAKMGVLSVGKAGFCENSGV